MSDVGERPSLVQSADTCNLLLFLCLQTLAKLLPLFYQSEVRKQKFSFIASTPWVSQHAFHSTCNSDAHSLFLLPVNRIMTCHCKFSLVTARTIFQPNVMVATKWDINDYTATIVALNPIYICTTMRRRTAELQHIVKQASQVNKRLVITILLLMA